MSGKPSPGGAEEVIRLIRAIAAFDEEGRKLSKDLKEATERLKEINEHRRAADSQLEKKLTAMDVESPGNFGWRGRFSWLLAEIVRQVERETHAEDKKEEKDLAFCRAGHKYSIHSAGGKQLITEDRCPDCDRIEDKERGTYEHKEG